MQKNIKNENFNKLQERKDYQQPQLEQIGNMNKITKGASGSSVLDGSGYVDPFNIPFPGSGG